MITHGNSAALFKWEFVPVEDFPVPQLASS